MTKQGSFAAGLLAVLALVSVASAQLQQTSCVMSCLAVDNSTLTYCLGFVDYTSCVSQKDVTTLTADQRAYNNSLTMPKFSDSQGCINAQKRLLCALLFPKCTLVTSGPVISQAVCTSTCVNFFQNCNVQLTTQCALTNGTGPSNFCTGRGALAGASALLMLLLAMFLFL